MTDPRATHRDLSPCPRCGTPNVAEVVMYAGDLQPYIALHHHRCMWLADHDSVGPASVPVKKAGTQASLPGRTDALLGGA